MRRIVLFGEDDAHERVVTALLSRLSLESGIPVQVVVRSSIGGYGRAIDEFSTVLGDIVAGRESKPDLIVVATDSNCKGLNERLKAIAGKVPQALKELVACAVPSPHIERWLLLDSAAFKEVLGRGCEAPDMKCRRDRYKQLLANAVRDAGVRPLLGGMEYSNDIIGRIDLERAAQHDDSFGRCLKELRRFFKQWRMDLQH